VTQDDKMKVYALSTCPRCRRMKDHLTEKGVAHESVDVDLLPSEEKREIMDYLHGHKPVISFPVLEKGEKIVIGALPGDEDKFTE
jgi:glutaredoxin-like protein NrdH